MPLLCRRQLLRQQLNDYFGAAATNIELNCTENNSVYGNPGKQSTSLVNGLFLADSIAQNMQTEFNSVLWWDLRNGQDGTQNNSASLYGWRNYGDYGITDGSDPSTAVNRYPTFYAAKLLKYFARGGDHTVRAISDYAQLATYATLRTNGFLALMFINKSATNSLNANIAVTGYRVSSNAAVFSYGIPQDLAASTNNIAGSDIAKTNLIVTGTNFTYTFPPYSITVIAIAGASNSVVGLQPIGIQTNGMNLQISGLPDLRYLIQSSTNLIAWPTIATNTLHGIADTWPDPAATNSPRKFYRSVWLP